MIEITYHNSGWSFICVTYSSKMQRYVYCAQNKSWYIEHPNGSTLMLRHKEPLDCSNDTPIIIFDVDTVYDPDLDEVYFCRTPEAECALEIARASRL